MIGDKLVISDYHRAGANQVLEQLRGALADRDRPLAVTVAGESGSGKSEIAHCLAELLREEKKEPVILCQDDYFLLPPRTNHDRRLGEIGRVGPGEVRLELLDEHISALKERPDEPLEKPLVFFEEDRIGAEVLQPGPGRLRVIIVEGTYTSMLGGGDLRVFIDRDYRQNRKTRLKRARDPDHIPTQGSG